MSTLREITLGALLAESAQRFPHNLATVYAGKTMTYAALYHMARSIAKGLLVEGVGHGAHVAIWSADRPNALACFCGVTMIGAVAVMVNTSVGKEELQCLLSASDAKYLLYGDGYKGLCFPEMAMELPIPLVKVYIGEGGKHEPCTLDDLIRRGRLIGSETLDAAVKKTLPSDSATILFTSGTVGANKGVLTSHFSRVNNAILQAEDLRATQEDIFLVALPMFHCFSLSANIFAALSVGACLCFPENRRSRAILDAVVKTRCTILHGVPTLFHALLASPHFHKASLASLRIGLIGGAVLDSDEMMRFRSQMGYELMPSLGLTECTAGITVTSPDDSLYVKLHTVGHFMKWTEGCILDDVTGEICSAHRIGEICVRGYCVMQGYYKLPAQTAEVMDANGFLHTGDLGYLDGEGNVHFAGRKKEIVIRGGEKIFPGEIESCILKNPLVSAAKVLGIPDAHYGEQLCACIVPEPGASITKETLQDWMGERLADYKVPTYVLLLPELPVGPSGKVRAELLRKMVEQQIAEDGKRGN